MEQNIDLCAFCNKQEADIVDYGLVICNPCLDARPLLQTRLAESCRNDPVERDHED